MTDLRNQSRENDAQGADMSPVDLPACVSDLVKAVIRGMEDEMAPYDISSLEYGVLKDCMDKGECTATELAAVLPVDASRISRIVNVLVERGLLIRRRLQEDRRIVMLRLSDKGRELTSILNQRVQTYNATLMENVAEGELSVFASVTRRIVANHTAMQSSQGPQEGA